MRAQPVPSALTVLVVAGMILIVMMTAGRTVAMEREVLASVDDAGTRTIRVSGPDAAGLHPDVLDRIAHIDGIEWAGAFSSAIDATNTLNPDGLRVPVRLVYSDRLDRLGISRVTPPGSTAYASQDALDRFGLPDIGGAITLTTGQTSAIGARIAVPDFLSEWEPLTLIPADRSAPAPVTMIVVIAESPQYVRPLTDAVLSVLAADDSSKVSVRTSEELAQLRGLIQSQLGSSSRALVLGLLAMTAVLVAVILFGLVMMRRRDFGRRRALGATRGYIVVLLLTQTGLLAVIGVAAGVSAATIAAVAVRGPLPDAAFASAVGVLAVIAATLAALVPATVASRREPIRELRVP